jgi:hypothetical protein
MLHFHDDLGIGAFSPANGQLDGRSQGESVLSEAEREGQNADQTNDD